MATPTLDDLSSNALISTLTEEDRKRLTPHMFLIELKAGDILQEAGQDVVDTWFPCGSALASYSVPTDQDNNSVEVAMIGREGAIGGIVSNGQIPSYSTAQVRMAGRFIRIKTAALEQLKLESINLRHWFSRYSDYLLAQVFQNAACNARHTITQRAARWLLSAMERTHSKEFPLTQEQLAEMLGVGRTFVTRTIRTMREDGLISSRRGVFIICDEAGLKNRSCQCTAALEDHFDVVLHGIYPRK